jgi:hypothetical protein
VLCVVLIVLSDPERTVVRLKKKAEEGMEKNTKLKEENRMSRNKGERKEKNSRMKDGRLGGMMFSVLAIVPKVRRFKPGRGDGF